VMEVGSRLPLHHRMLRRTTGSLPSEHSTKWDDDRVDGEYQRRLTESEKGKERGNTEKRNITRQMAVSR